MAKAAIKFTYEDYKNLPESETQRYELLEGELVMVPSPSFEHQDISGNLEFLLRLFVREHKLGVVLDAPLDVVLGEAGEEHVVQPDILFISKTRKKIIRQEEIRGAPDLVVEILSPYTGQRDRTVKKKLYARYGVKEYWIVDPEEEAIEVWALGRGGYERVALYKKADMLTSSLLPGLKIPLREVF